ncbi:Aldo-keto reductase family 1 member A1-A [Taenia crassiceps]|uniref:Aldo-keto reductase family 1 member A1-A n=1 Tax=Taenia crassiceps TaxID=6207 RepID=A0ABR4QBV9_9CEST
MSLSQCLQLNSGYEIPRLGFGTFEAPKEVVAGAVEFAISTGYRHIDCAMSYGNEREVGEGIATSMKKYNLRREDVFVTSKLWCDKHAPEDVRKACEVSLKDLGLQYLDLYLIHLPAPIRRNKDVPFNINDPNTFTFEHHKIEDTWKAMEELVSAGLARSIGVSNFNKRQLERILTSCRIPPAVNQVEVNIHFPNTKLIEFCHSKNILIEGYAPLGSPAFVSRFTGTVKCLMEDENVVEVANEHKKTPAQVLLRHELQRGIVVLVGCVLPEFIKSDFDVFDFELSDAEIAKLNKIVPDGRLIRWPGVVNHPEYPFRDEY